MKQLWRKIRKKMGRIHEYESVQHGKIILDLMEMSRNEAKHRFQKTVPLVERWAKIGNDQRLIKLARLEKLKKRGVIS